MVVVMKTWHSSHTYNMCCVNTKTDFQLTGRKKADKGEESEISDSEYVADTVIIFESRADCERMAPLMVKHFVRWGWKYMSAQKQTKN